MAKGARAAGMVAVLVAAVGCAGDDLGGDDDGTPGDDGGGECEVGRTSAALSLPDRAIAGPGDLYPADGALRGREQELRESLRSRREVAWQVVERALTPVAMAEELPSGLPGELPRFQTWYGRDDFQRMFHRLYLGIGVEGRAARAPFDDAAIDEALGWNVEAVHEAESWPAERFEAYLEAIDEQAEVGGIGGISRVGYSPGAARHVLASYAETLPCVYRVPPPAFGEGESAPVRQLLRQAVDVGACERREIGPFFVASGEELRAAVDEGPEASLRLLAGPPEAREEVCAAAAGEPCRAPGPGPITVEVAAGETGGRAVVAVELGEAQPTWAACLSGPFPIDAAVVKADWRRSEFGEQLAVHDTSADGLSRTLGGDQDWGEGDATADPGADEIYTVVLPNGQRYRLAGLHIMTKELDHWMWTTMWWSPDPDSDFGADRPAAIAALGGPWSHYKMCTVAWFREEDPDPAGGFADSAPSLADALVAAHRGASGPSWCSNPYLEVGSGNAATNCTGCHQHGGTGLAPETILDDPRFPERGRLQVRNNFATDYSWAVDSGDRLGRLIADEVEYYDSFE